MLKLTMPADPSLYLDDETSWLELMAQLIAEQRWTEVDYEHLSEFLTDMANRDRREVLNRLTILLAHLLKWEYQPEKRTSSWQATIKIQTRELQTLLASGTLRKHAREVLEKAYRSAKDEASTETGLPESTFPEHCPYPLEAILGEEKAPPINPRRHQPARRRGRGEIG